MSGNAQNVVSKPTSESFELRQVNECVNTASAFYFFHSTRTVSSSSRSRKLNLLHIKFGSEQCEWEMKYDSDTHKHQRSPSLFTRL